MEENIGAICIINFTALFLPDLIWFSCFSGASPKIIKLQEDSSDYGDQPKGKVTAVNSTLVPVKGINNLGNTCFFNAVMQVGVFPRKRNDQYASNLSLR